MKKLLYILLGLFAFVMIVGSIVGNTPEGKERREQKDKIERCWEIQGKKSLDPSTARFAAGMCEKLEDDYTRRWGTRP